MLIVIALGGNALLQRHDKPDAGIQHIRARQAVRAVAPLAADHQLVITHGNGPQVGLLAVESTQDATLDGPYPLDVLGAESEGMIGHWLSLELRNALPSTPVASLLTQTLVDEGDPAYHNPTKFIGIGYEPHTAHAIAEQHGWTLRRDGNTWRRVVPSPEPQDILDIEVLELLLRNGTIPVCAGGGGVPVVRTADGQLAGTDAVIDKDLTAALIATRLHADALLMLTDVAHVEQHWGTPLARPLHRATPAQLRQMSFAAGSMAPKVEAACRFVEQHGATGRAAVAGIGRLADAADILAGHAGTLVAGAPVAASAPPVRAGGPAAPPAT
ncbi:carbamate kinase [Actinocatenispora thailandica]|uniref:Carbamate kinase n=1 Tax=Actinocatenispora thailandica TaxID=227318 RepID=A0A7R7HWJ4_9ACTN|nr:carbamate kinase [Actinocatenispora thailandica]BCJ34039.1 carbamate kinase [Actinocatenispora thailandica]